MLYLLLAAALTLQAAPGDLAQKRDEYESARLRGGVAKGAEDRKQLAEAVEKGTEGEDDDRPGG